MFAFINTGKGLGSTFSLQRGEDLSRKFITILIAV